MAEYNHIRSQVRSFLREELANRTFVPAVDNWLSGVDPGFSERVAARGWLAMTWPKAYGGHERSALERYVVIEELLAAGAPVAAHWIADRQSGPNILKFGTEEMKQEVLPRIAAGQCYFAIGMSEPDAGSDLAAIRTRARRNEDGDWVVNGAKIWTSNAQYCHYAIVLVRTSDRDEGHRHAGMSQLVVDLHSPGVTISPIQILDGSEHLNEVAFDNVVVPAGMLLGAEGNGWDQVTAELAYERSGPERFLSTMPLLSAFHAAAARSDDQEWLITLGGIGAQLMGLRELSTRIAGALDRGDVPSMAAALVKDLGTTFEVDSVELVRAVAESPAVPAADDALAAALMASELHTPGFTLRGGTNEVLRTIVARGLGLR